MPEPDMARGCRGQLETNGEEGVGTLVICSEGAPLGILAERRAQDDRTARGSEAG